MSEKQTRENTFPGLCHHLHTATLCSFKIEDIRKFYVNAMGMKMEGPFELSKQQVETQRKLWDLPADLEYEYYHIHREATPSLIHIRFLHLKQETPHIEWIILLGMETRHTWESFSGVTGGKTPLSLLDHLPDMRPAGLHMLHIHRGHHVNDGMIWLRRKLF